MLKYFLAFILVFTVAPAAKACAILETANPKVGAEVKAPSTVELKFSSKIYPEKSTLEVFDSAGNTVSTGKPYGKTSDNTVIATAVKPLPPGKYKVKWNTWCDCESLTPGDYKFTVTP